MEPGCQRITLREDRSGRNQLCDLSMQECTGMDAVTAADKRDLALQPAPYTGVVGRSGGSLPWNLGYLLPPAAAGRGSF